MKSLRYTGIFILSILIFTNCSDSISSNDFLEIPDDELTVKSKKNNSSNNSGYSFYNMGPGSYTYPLNFNTLNGKAYFDKEYTLWAGKDSEAGRVVISYGGTSMFVTYETNGTAQLGEVHVYLWYDEDDIPNRRPAPGQAPFKAENINDNTYTIEIPLDYFLCGSSYYISTHAALVGPGSNAGETAYSGSGGFAHMKGGSWWGYVENNSCFDPN